MIQPSSNLHSERVLVLDGSQRAALAVTRALGRRGLPIIVAESVRDTIAGASRYCVERVVHRSALEDPQGFLEDIEQAVKRLGITSIFPITDVSTMLLADRVERLAPARLCAPSAASYEAVTDKGTLVSSAQRLGVPVPETLRATSAEEIAAAAREIGYPAVLKPTRSRFEHEGAVIATAVRIVRRETDLSATFARTAWLGKIPCLVQEFVPGHGAGVFTVYGKGGALAWFAHRRIREMPPSGGVSVLCESAPVDAELMDYSERLLADARWFGPAMVEFRIGPQGRPYLMEINGRFWGSLQLPIDCHVDFPWLLLLAARGEEVQGPGSYRTGKRLRWLLRDVDNLAAQLRDPKLSLATKATAAGAFAASAFDLGARQELFRWHDPGPACREIAVWLGSMSALKRLRGTG